MLIRNKTLLYASFALVAVLLAWTAYGWRTETDPGEGWIPVNDLLKSQMLLPDSGVPQHDDPSPPAENDSDPPASSAENDAPSKPTSMSDVPVDSKININTATPEQLTELPGIGPSKAKAIVEYRDSVGRFQTVDELLHVKGIGDKTFQRLKDLVTVGSPSASPPAEGK